MRDYQALAADEVPRLEPHHATAGARARAALGQAATPAQLPCRDAERLQISRFLEEALAPGAAFVVESVTPS